MLTERWWVRGEGRGRRPRFSGIWQETRAGVFPSFKHFRIFLANELDQQITKMRLFAKFKENQQNQSTQWATLDSPAPMSSNIATKVAIYGSELANS